MWESLAIQGGPWGLVALTVVSLIRGWLIPRSWHRERIADLKAAMAADKETIREQKAQIAILLGGVREPTG